MGASDVEIYRSNAQRLIQSKAGFVSVAALLCLSAPARLVRSTGDRNGTAGASRPRRRRARRPGAGSERPDTAGQPADDANCRRLQLRRRDATADRPVTGNQPQRPARRPAATPARQAPPTPPAQPAQPAEPVAAAGTGQGTLTSPGYQASTLGVGRFATPICWTRRRPSTSSPSRSSASRMRRTVRDALRNVAGVTFRAGEGGNQGDTPYIRGFSAQNDIFRDGVRDPGWYTRDTFAVDAVEVYKGPASVLFGRGSTGGVINLISKTPFERNAIDTTLTANTGPGVSRHGRCQRQGRRQPVGPRRRDGSDVRHRRPRQYRAEPLRHQPVADVQAEPSRPRSRPPTSCSATTTFPTTAFRSCRRPGAFRGRSRRSRAAPGTAS